MKTIFLVCCITGLPFIALAEETHIYTNYVVSTGCDGTEGLIPQEIIDELGGKEKAKAYFEEISKVFTEEYRTYQSELDRVVKESGASESDIVEARIEAGEDDEKFLRFLSEKVGRQLRFGQGVETSDTETSNLKCKESGADGQRINNPKRQARTFDDQQ